MPEIEAEAVLKLLSTGGKTTYQVAFELGINDLDAGRMLLNLVKLRKVRMESPHAYGPRRFSKEQT